MTKTTATYTLTLDPDQATLLAELLGDTNITFDPVQDMISIPASGFRSKIVTGARGDEFVRTLQNFATLTGGLPSTTDLKPFAKMTAANRAALLSIAATACSWEEIQGRLILVTIDDNTWNQFRTSHPEAFYPPPQTQPPSTAWYFVKIPAPTVKTVQQLVTSAGGTFFPEKHVVARWHGDFIAAFTPQDLPDLIRHINDCLSEETPPVDYHIDPDTKRYSAAEIQHALAFTAECVTWENLACWDAHANKVDPQALSDLHTHCPRIFKSAS